MEFNARQKKVIYAEEPNILCLASAASGKAIPNSTIIPTINGVKRVDEIKKGDYLFDRNGNPTKVLGVFPQGKKEVFEITFGDGRKAKSSKDHIWFVNKRTWKDKNRYEEYTIEELLKEKIIVNRGGNFYIPCAKPVHYLEKKYEIHPYIIGAFLGDGCCLEKELVISSENDTIPNHIKELLQADEIHRNPANYNWYFKKGGVNIKSNILPIELKKYSYEKSIPKEYKYGSIEQRLELIRGLMDTDGSISIDKRENHSPCVSFTSTSYQLILDVKEVLGSLGYVSTISEDKRSDKYTKGIAYSLNINISNSEKYKLFWLKRKKDIALSIKNKKQHRDYMKTTIRKIEDLGFSEEMTCFYVDNAEHLFLMNDFIVTHNTSVLTERIKVLINERNMSPSDIVAITFTRMAADEMVKRLDGVANGAFIGTIHSYANKICVSNNIDTQKFLEYGEFDKILKKANTLPSSRYFQIKHLLVDECQDISPLEYAFLEKIPSENVFFCGDNRQMIYAFKGTTDEYLVSMYRDANYKKYFLTENYRNAPNILKFADSLIASHIQLSPKSIPVRTKGGDVIQGSFYEALEELEYSENWGSWFILTRTNAEIIQVQEILNKKKIPNITFKKGDLDLEEMGQLMQSDRVKILTIHTSKGLESNNVIVIGANLYNEEERRLAYVAATRAKNSLYWCPSIKKRRKYDNENKKINRTKTDIIEF